MKTLSANSATEAAAESSRWAEVYDFYLKSAISTPYGTTSVVRITNCPGNLAFFKPALSPETDQGGAATYYHWPVQRDTINGSAKTQADTLKIMVSNVTGDWAGMLSAVDWESVPVIVRKVAISLAAPVAADAVLMYAGQVDAWMETLKQISFTCSNDLGGLSILLPRENMHTSCRAKWGDDLCGRLKFALENYKSKTVGTGSTSTVVISGGLTEDSYVSDLLTQTDASLVPYGTDLVNALANAAITTSSSNAFSGVATYWDSIQTGGSMRFGYTYNYAFTITPYSLAIGTAVVFAASGAMPTGLTAGVTYYVAAIYSGNYMTVAATLGGAAITVSSAGSGVTVTTTTAPDGYAVKSSYPSSYWSFSAYTDWGDNAQGYWQIPSSPTNQQGLANFNLKPWIQFDFGTARALKTWRLQCRAKVKLEELVRMVVLFSSTDGNTWKHQTYFEMPQQAGQLVDLLLPKATAARYWRICVRTRWAEVVYYSLLAKVYAYEDSRNWWADGQITFDAATTTAALRGVSRSVLESYNGQLRVAKLPAAPVAGDVFTIERGCAGTWNACCERQNWNAFAGHLTLPFETVVR